MMRVMLSIYRRHTDDCVHKGKGRSHHRCHCPIWIDGTKDGRRYNRALGTRVWAAAAEKLRDIELGVTAVGSNRTLRRLAEEYLVDCEARYLSAASIKKYRAALLGSPGAHRKRRESDYTPALVMWAESHQIATAELTTDVMTRYRATWREKPSTATKRLETLRAFFAWAMVRGHMAINPAKALRPPIDRGAPKLPYSDAEMEALLQACDREWPQDREEGPARRARLRVLLLLLRYTGLRIGDAMRLGPRQLRGQRVVVRTAKTGQAVMVPIPAFLVAALKALQPVSPDYWFWDGHQNLDKTQDRYRDQLLMAGRQAREQLGVDVGKVEFHRIRDTFATALLSSGVSVEHVAALLGHANIKITLKHYSPWVRERQLALEADVTRVLERDKGVERESARYTSATPRGL